MQNTTSEQSKTSAINGNLIQSGGGFSFNGKLFDEYLDNRSCAIFRDINGNTFDSICIYQAVRVSISADLYISTDKGLFIYNTDTGNATALSYNITDMVHMRLIFYTNGSNNNNRIIGFYPLSTGGYGVRKITLDTTGILESEIMENATIPDSDVTWMTYKNGFDNAEFNEQGNIDYPICYRGNEMWFLRSTQINKETLQTAFNEIRHVTLSDITEITQAINKNTALIKLSNNSIEYFVINTRYAFRATGESLEYGDIGYTFEHTTSYNITWYDQYHASTSDISSTLELIIDNANADSKRLSFAYLVSSGSTFPIDYKLYNIDGDVLNGGEVSDEIRHRMYTTIDESGYTNGTSVYATRRHIFASSTRLMDINENPFAALNYFRAKDTTNYSIVPSAGKTPIFTINASIEIDSKKYGNVIATDYNTVKGLYYIYTDSHVGIYFMITQQLTWAKSDIMTQIEDNIYTVGDITVIDGYAKEFVNGIMTTTAMNGPTFDQLFAEIDELRKRIAALESKA